MLISCPKCGKTVSDKAQKCLHCGFSFNKKFEIEEPKKDIVKKSMQYYELDAEKRKELFLQFGNDNPLQYKAINSNKIQLILQLIVGGAAILMTIISIILLLTVGKDRLDVVEPQTIDFLIAFGPLAVSFLLWGVFAVVVMIEKATRQKKIIAFRQFEDWLNERNIEGFAEMQMDNSVERERLEDLNI